MACTAEVGKEMSGKIEGMLYTGCDLVKIATSKNVAPIVAKIVAVGLFYKS